MKLLLVHNFYREDGGESSVFRLLAAILRAHGDTVVEYTRHNRELDAGGAPARARTLVAGFHSPRTAREVTALVREAKPDVAFVQNVFPLISPSVYTALRRAGAPIVQLVYNYRFICPNAHLYTHGAICERCVRGSTLNAIRQRCYQGSHLSSSWYAGILGWHRARGTFAAIDHFLVPDHFMREKLAAGGLPVDRMTVVGNPFEVHGYAPGGEEGDYILFVGRLIPQKGIMTLVRAFARAQTGSRLVVVGDGPMRGAADELARETAPGKVVFRGTVWGPELRELLARCRFLCVPSEWYDNAPLVLYQAFALGKPAIVSDINGLPEVVEHGQQGLLAAPGDVQAWCEQIARLDGDASLRRRLGRNARRKAESEFTAAAYYRRLRKAVDALVA